MTVKEAKEVLENMLNDYYGFERPSITKMEAEAIETVLEYLER